MRVLRVEPTPNPNAIKFIVDRQFADGREFKQKSDAGGDGLARKLFEIQGIDTLFFNADYITVSMKDDADWHAVHDSVSGTILAHEPEGQADGRTALGGLVSGAADDQELMGKIQSILEQRVMPALAADGGGMQLLGLDSKVLSIRYQGACGSCPSAMMGTLRAIEDLLRHEVDQELRVVPA
ncbi:MAG: NifU family protein [Planctomycetota bacterium]